ncbi:ABC transporter substrate-binding protein [Streptosporangium sp. NPDC049644]|uniref:ABC transporter substrate-binding protein n=1 Tax=Streptosporangium sp. NPDC049644 TaxID=3155507 RepID=UPI00342A9632
MRSARLRMIAVVLCLALAGCGGAGTSSAQDDVFVVAITKQPPHLMRMFLGDATVGLVGLAISESLVTVNRENEVEPQLAKSWEQPDDKTYRFHLVPQVTWHDGKPFTSADVVYSLTEGLGVNPSTASLKAMIDSVKAVDDLTVDVVLKNPSGAFLAMLNPMSITILPKHVYEGTDLMSNPANRAPVGTGPYKFQSWEGNQITLVRNDAYWDGKAAIPTVVFSVSADPNARALALKNGDIDYINSFDLPYEALRQLQNTDGITLDTGRASTSMQQLQFNMRNPVLAKPEVRKALFSAIDRKFISQTVFGGLSPAGTAALPADHWANSGEVDYMQEFPFDPVKAGAALDAAGYPKDASGKRFPMTLRFDTGIPGSERTAEVMADNWRSIGVDVTVMADEREVFTDAVYAKHKFDAFIINIAAGADPAIGLYRRYTCDNGQNAVFGNASGYCNKALDELFAQANASNDRAERTSLYAKAQRVIADDLPVATTIQVQYTDAIRTEFGGKEGFLSRGEVVMLDWNALTPAAAK